MTLRGPVLLLLTAVFASLGASYRTTNFVVEAPTQQLAQQVGQYAEHYRKEKALQWLGQEMQTWPEPCPLRVTVTNGGAGGATSFAFDRGRVLGQSMHIEGTVERLLNSVLPHEVTHTVFAYQFRRPVPRWADEGGSVLSEDETERNRHDQLCRQILNTPGRAIPLRRLFALTEYPADVMALYAQGFCVSNFLVGQSNRQQFLGFVGMGMREGWDRAAKAYYNFNSVEELEQAWLTHMKNTKKQPGQPAMTAQNMQPGQPDPRVVVRTTAPPVQPAVDMNSPLVARGRAEEEVPAAPPGRPQYLPDYNPGSWSHPRQASMPRPAAAPGGEDRWQPAIPAMPPQVMLGSPEPEPPAAAALGRPFPIPMAGSGPSPVGYPR
jgi:hypothetical protein